MASRIGVYEDQVPTGRFERERLCKKLLPRPPSAGERPQVPASLERA